MTDLVFNDCADDVEAVMVAWLTPLRRCSVTRIAGDELPFTLVKHVAGTENPGEGLADPIVSVHTLCDRSYGESEAAYEAQLTHRRMLLLAEDPLATVALPGGVVASCSSLDRAIGPAEQAYGAETVVTRFISEYTLTLRFAPA